MTRAIDLMYRGRIVFRSGPDRDDIGDPTGKDELAFSVPGITTGITVEGLRRLSAAVADLLADAEQSK